MCCVWGRMGRAHTDGACGPLEALGRSDVSMLKHTHTHTFFWGYRERKHLRRLYSGVLCCGQPWLAPPRSWEALKLNPDQPAEIRQLQTPTPSPITSLPSLPVKHFSGNHQPPPSSPSYSTFSFRCETPHRVTGYTLSNRWFCSLSAERPMLDLTPKKSHHLRQQR